MGEKKNTPRLLKVGKTYWTVPKGWKTGYGTLKGTKLKVPVIMKKTPKAPTELFKWKPFPKWGTMVKKIKRTPILSEKEIEEGWGMFAIRKR